MQSIALDSIQHGDSLELLKKIPDGKIDMVFADPPYNLQLQGDLCRPDQTKVAAVTDTWDQFETFQSYDAFSKAWLQQCRRILKKDGTIWVMGSYHNIFRIGTLLQDLGFWMLNDIIWRKNNPMPNFAGRRFTNAHETLLWCGRQKDSHYTFNYESLKALNEDLQMRSDWELPICAGHERLKNGAGKKIHPTQKPEALLYRVLTACTRPGDVVLDPFFGTGTTGVVAKRLGRHFIGFEQDAGYIRAAQDRLDAVETLEESHWLKAFARRKQLRIPFGLVLEYGYLRPGDTLCDPRQIAKARVRADGTLVMGNDAGSIHQLGAKIQQTPSCNGWQFWHAYKNDKTVLIDTFRQEIRGLLEATAPQGLSA